MVEDKKIAWPAQLAIGGDGMGNSLDHIREIMGTSMESLIHHFKLVTEGFRVPPGQAYAAIESPKGELGCHVVSDGGTRPYRAHFRDPSFNNLQATAAMCEGSQVADVDRRRGLDRPRDGRRGPLMTTTEHRRCRRRPTRPRPSRPRRSRSCTRTRQQVIARYPQARSALLPLLHLVQSVDGYVVRTRHRVLRRGLLDLTTAEVSGVATFYTQYKRHPNGDYTVGVCTNTLCAIMGGDQIWESVSDHLGIGHDETTADGRITLERIECNAACDYAPVVMANWEFFDNQTPESHQPARRRPARRRGRSRRPAARGGVCDFQQVSRVLAGFPDGRADEGAGAGARVPAWVCGWPASAAGPRRTSQEARAGGADGGPATDADAAGSGAEHLRARRRQRRSRGRDASPRPTAPRTTPTRRLRAGRARHEHPADADPHQVLGRPPVLDHGDLRAARRLPGAAQRARRCRRPTWCSSPRTPACAAAAAPASRPA